MAPCDRGGTEAPRTTMRDGEGHGVPVGSRNRGRTAPEIAGPTDTESLWQGAVWHRVPAERGSWAEGQPAEGCEAPG